MFNFIAKSLLVPERFYSLFDVLLIAVFIVFILLKIVALRRSWINGQKAWFVVLIVINTLGILEMIYLLTNKEKPRSAEEIEKINEKKLNKKKKKILEKAEIAESPKEEAMIIGEPAMSIPDIDNADLSKEEVVETFNEIASEDETLKMPTDDALEQENHQ